MCSLVYRASEDGFRAKGYHEKSHSIPNTLTIVKSTSGNLW